MWQADPLCWFWTVWKARNKVAFEDEIFSKRVETSLVFLLWSKTKLSMSDSPLTIAELIDWVGCK